MSKEIFIKAYTEKVNKNYGKIEPFFHDKLIILSSLNHLKYEILNCLIIEQNISAINCTNHFLERLLKLALIENEIKELKIKFENQHIFNSKVIEASDKFDSLLMFDTIRYSFDKGIISLKVKEELNRIRKEIRNSYSHSEMEKINKGKNKEIQFSVFDINQVLIAKKNDEKIDQKKIHITTKTPFIQSQIQTLGAEKLAFSYFTKVYKLAKDIDIHLDFEREYYK